MGKKTNFHTIRLARRGDIQEIMNFFRDNWRSDHILACNQGLFEYEFCSGKAVNFILALNKDTGNIEGTIGFIQYTKALKNSDVFTVMWKVMEGNGDPFLGVKLLEYLIEEMPFRSVSTCGANSVTLPIYEFLRYRVGNMAHYYLLNDHVENFRIAELPEQFIFPVKQIEDTGLQLVGFEFFDDLAQKFDFRRYQETVPYKDSWYFRKRYFEHPVYSYRVFGLQTKEGINSLIVTRFENFADSNCLRIIDFIGRDPDLRGLANPLRQVLYDYNCEYADFYCWGLPQVDIDSTGLINKTETPNVIIPNYFWPLFRENIDINVFTTYDGPIRILKGDGDQDRPN